MYLPDKLILASNPIPNPPIPPSIEDPSGGVSSIFSASTLILIIIFAICFYVIKAMRKSSQNKAVAAYKEIASPLYTSQDSNKVFVYPGWYPTPDGLKDRYNDGEKWTDHYRDHTEEGKLGDAPPKGVTPTMPESITEPIIEKPDSKPSL